MTLVLALIALNVVVSLASFRAMQTEGGRGTEAFVFVPYQVARGENGIGLLLAHFAHRGVLHLAFNMLALYSFASTVLDALGVARFFFIYLIAGFGSDLIVFALHKDDPTYRCLGASGSVFGIMMAAVVLDPRTSIALLFVPISIPGPVFMIGYAIVSLILITRRVRDGISHEGHLGGAVLALAVTVLFAPRGLSPLFRWFAQWL